MCKQDFTWRSNSELANLQHECVGKRNEIESVSPFRQLSGITQRRSEHRVVHVGRRYGRKVTVELTTKFIDGVRHEVVDLDIVCLVHLRMYLMKRQQQRGAC